MARLPKRNAHPHISKDGLAVVHNGIIENHEAMRARLSALGYRFVSDTDTEVRRTPDPPLPRAESGDLFAATHRAVSELTGAYAIAVLSEKDPGTLVVARKGAPLLLGLGENENFCASDASALLQVTRRIVYLEEGDVVELRTGGHRILDAPAREVERAVHESKLSADAVELGPYRHYMQKEIFEQPGAVAATLEMVTGASSIVPQLFGVDAEEVLRSDQRRHRARLRHQLPRRPGGTLLDRGDRRHALQRGDRQRVSLSAERAEPAALVDRHLPVGRDRGHHRRAAARQVAGTGAARWRSATCRRARWSATRGCAFSRAPDPRSAWPRPRPSPPNSPALFLLTLVLAKLRGRLSAEDEAGASEGAAPPAQRALPHVL